MARPRADAGEMPARQRVIEAFWAMLSEGPYEGITVRGLAARANVSPNTLYYHFECVEDVAATALAEEIDEGAARIVMSLGVGAGDAAELAHLGAADAGRFARIRLFAASGSGALSRMLTAALVRTWLSAAGVDEPSLSDDARRDLTFVLGGVVALLGSDLADDPAALARLFSRPLGRGVAETMAALAR